jgi:hypothetical protein
MTAIIVFSNFAGELDRIQVTGSTEKELNGQINKKLTGALLSSYGWSLQVGDTITVREG